MVFVSCENSPNDKVTEKTEDLTGQFSLSINNKVSESIFANSRGIESSRKLVVEKYRITGSGPNGELLEEKTIQATASSSVSYKSLSIGEWIIKVEALNEEGAIVGEGSKSIKIEKGKEITESIDVYECEGEGTLHVNIEYDNNTDSSIELIVSDASGKESSHSTLSRTGNTYSIAFPLSNGFYRLDMKVDGGEKIFLETVRIVKGATTSFSATYETKNGNIISNIVTHIVTTPEITLTLESESVAQNGILNAKAVVSGMENASYSWYIDGSLINGATETSLSYGGLSTLAFSNHRLTFVVSNGEVIWSKDANFEVKEAFYIEDFTINAKNEYIYTDKLDVTLSKSFDDTYSIKWYLDSKEIIPSDINLSDYLGNHRLMAVVEKNGVSSSGGTDIYIKAVASNLKIDSAYEGLTIKGSVSIQPESVKNRSIGIMFEKIDGTSSSYTYVYVDENGNFSGSMPDIIKAGKYKAYIQDSSVKCDDIVEVEVQDKPTFTISGPTTIKQYATAVFELLPDPSLSYINWEIDGNYVYSNNNNEKNKFVLKYDSYSPSNYPAVGEHKLTAKNGGNELASISFTVEALGEMDSIIIEALPDYYNSTNNVTSATGNAHMKIKFDNTQATLADGCLYIANTYNEDYVTCDFTITYLGEAGSGCSAEVKGNVDITYKETESHYSIGSLKCDFTAPMGENPSVTISNVKAEKVFKDNRDISNDESEINMLVSFAIGLTGTSEGVTFVEYETTAKQKWEYTNYKNNENSEYIVNGSVIGEQNRTDLNSGSYIFSSSFTFEKESETHTFSYDISYKVEAIKTENGYSSRYYDTVISNVMFDGNAIDLKNLTDAAISRMKDFVGDREW